MTLLEVIKQSSASSEPLASRSDYPILLNPDDILTSLKSKVDEPDPVSLVNPIIGWKISETDSKVIDLGKKFHENLKLKLKNRNFSKPEFIKILNVFLEKVRETVGIVVGVSSSDNRYTKILIEKLGFVMSEDIGNLVLDTCIALEEWELVETFVVNRLVKHASYSNLILKLVAKKRSDLLCLCIKQASDFGPADLHCILKYFLCPSKEAYASMPNVRKEWEDQALLAIEKASDKSLKDKKSNLAKEAAIQLMVAYDGFSTQELCLHYLLASPNLDEVILSSALNKLNHEEMIRLIRYLGKWLKRYERFPQAVHCPKAATVLGLKACDWVPKLDDVVRYLGLVLDENFSSLVLHPDFHEELKSMEELVSSLALESKLCCVVANVADNLRTEV
ncbi:uncharacterized protein LOC111803920 [Cucurbita pepo subsp. pepo]|uniref:uncharacterized protein LOC111803920 n=1 Tax=Cucurbita pepo subsp. pepo TaxID=3664 RepID=UPI000C9D2DA7|nr:uncharacterized protein LOC111803920 [Cucurbita pepo subsp. pepo]XP_023544304.1 uncharacterized protein LOC111803920 [Cucurbita pepo subsp. pepo]XP_023544305.1 uncharacterized protein LOC111803920 [Cucurbita pepo subsp. pepo]XP_023544306.1 uncharacterized protein LOC111803920 [Cucurbita pepo subsp. pepo]